MSSPQLALRSCEDCRAWLYDLQTGLPIIDRKGNKQPRKTPTPCELSGCPKGHWRAPIELSEMNQRAFLHWQECDAIGSWPDDPVVRKNAAIIKHIVSRAEADLRNAKLQLSILSGR